MSSPRQPLFIDDDAHHEHAVLGGYVPHILIAIVAVVVVGAFIARAFGWYR